MATFRRTPEDVTHPLKAELFDDWHDLFRRVRVRRCAKCNGILQCLTGATRIATLPTAETWQTRVRQLVVATVGTAEPGSPPILPEIAHLEHRIADNTHHRRVYEELVAAWTVALAECPDLPTLPDARLRRLVLIAWGAFRYAWLAAPDELKTGAYVDEISDLLIAALDPNFEVAG